MTTPDATSRWEDLGKLIGAAAGVVTLVFCLFSSVLANVVPPVEAMRPAAVTGLASLVALVILLVLALVVRRRLTRVQRPRVALAAGAAALAGLALFFAHYGDLGRYAFRWPDEPTAPRHLRGEYNETGRQMTRDMSLVAAITAMGGLDQVRRMNLLWEEDSRREVERRLVAQYVVLTSLFSGSLFGLALALRPSAASRTRKAA
ncbi:MAG: hypothetical protein RL456_650 [Pseudomonadota bacterium]|jgi:hypothetical protein